MIRKRQISLLIISLLIFLCFHILCQASETITYTYDDLDRLTGVEYAGAGSISYVYNKAGNIVNITIKVTNSTIVDSDSDGIADDWEMMHFNSLATASPTSDADEDWYSDLWEYLNWRDGLLDRSGKTFSPNISNASRARGYGEGLEPRAFISAPWIPLLLLEE